MQAIQFDHVAIVARDYQATVQWYVEVLGFRVEREWTLPQMLPGARMAYLVCEGMRLEIIGDGEKAGHKIVAPDPLTDYKITGFRHLALRTADLDRLLAQLSERGVEPFFPATDFPPLGLRVALIRDPEDNTVELVQPLAS